MAKRRVVPKGASKPSRTRATNARISSSRDYTLHRSMESRSPVSPAQQAAAQEDILRRPREQMSPPRTSSDTRSTTSPVRGPRSVRFANQGDTDASGNDSGLGGSETQIPEASRQRSSQLPTPPPEFSPKRPLQDRPEPSPKRSRLSEMEEDQKYNLESEMADAPSGLPNLPATAEKLANDIKEYPHGLEPVELAHVFNHLRIQMRNFGHQFFAFDLTEAEKAAWPLAHLETKYDRLFRVTQYIADGNQNTWRSFFTDKIYRPHLVYGILGEYFKHYIFSETAFGVNEFELEKLRETDIRYLYYDAFVRSKDRGKVFEKQLEDKSILRRETDLNLAICNFVEKLLIVLEPLLPTFKVIRKKQQERDILKNEAVATIELSKIRAELANIIHLAVKIHWAIRLAGKTGQVVRICPHLSKGEKFEPYAPQKCINKKRCNETRNDPYADELQIKMTCFGRIEATIPYGPDRREVEEVYIEAVKRGDFVRKRVERPPQDIDGVLQEIPLVDGEEEEEETVVELRENNGLYPVLPDSLQDLDVGFKDERDAQGRVIPKTLVGPYVKVVQIMPADVYCEWVPFPNNPNGGLNTSPEHHLTLKQAVAEARTQDGLRVPDAAAALYTNVLSPLGQLGMVALVFTAATGRMPDCLRKYPGINTVERFVLAALSQTRYLKKLKELCSRHGLWSTLRKAIPRLPSTLIDLSSRELASFLASLPKAALAEIKAIVNNIADAAAAATRIALRIPDRVAEVSSAVGPIKTTIATEAADAFSQPSPAVALASTQAWGFRIVDLVTRVEFGPPLPQQVHTPAVVRSALRKIFEGIRWKVTTPDVAGPTETGASRWRRGG